MRIKLTTAVRAHIAKGRSTRHPPESQREARDVLASVGVVVTRSGEMRRVGKDAAIKHRVLRETDTGKIARMPRSRAELMRIIAQVREDERRRCHVRASNRNRYSHAR